MDLAFLAEDSQNSTATVGKVKGAVNENVLSGTEALKAGKIIGNSSSGGAQSLDRGFLFCSCSHRHSLWSCW